MTIAAIGTDGWDSVVTTTADTVFQNRSINAMYITTESTGGLPLDEGFLLNGGDAVVIGTGKAVSAVTFSSDGELFYMVLV